jgi:hypothetical protein
VFVYRTGAIDGHLGAIRPGSPSTANPADPAGRQEERGARGTHPDLFTEKLMRKIPAPLVLSFMAAAWLAGALPPAQAQRSAAGPLAMSVRDGFTIASVGDLIVAYPQSENPDPQFQGVLKLIRDADVGTGDVSIVRVRQAPASQP